MNHGCNGVASLLKNVDIVSRLLTLGSSVQDPPQFLLLVQFCIHVYRWPTTAVNRYGESDNDQVKFANIRRHLWWDLMSSFMSFLKMNKYPS